MTTTIVELPNRRAAMSIYLNLKRTIEEHYARWPRLAVEAGVRAGRIALVCDQEFNEALQTAEQTITTYTRRRWPTHPEVRRANRLAVLQERRKRRIAAFHSLVERQLRAQLQGQPESVVYMAICRAHRVLDGGGTLCAAMYHAIGHVPGEAC